MTRWFTRRKAIGTLGLAAAAAWAGREAYVLGADPTGPKDCGPLTAQGAAPTLPSDASLPWSLRSGTVNDVSCLSSTQVAGVVGVRSERDIAGALGFARTNGLKVSMAGARRSMGGHAFAPGGVVLDMTGFNAIKVDDAARTMTVESGARWHDIQNVLHPRFAVKAMQSSDVFTVGGSISVNAHGMDHQVGAIERTLRRLRVMLADGRIIAASRTENTELYRHVVGGYGLFGVILDAEIEITAPIPLSRRSSPPSGVSIRKACLATASMRPTRRRSSRLDHSARNLREEGPARHDDSRPRHKAFALSPDQRSA